MKWHKFLHYNQSKNLHPKSLKENLPGVLDIVEKQIEILNDDISNLEENIYTTLDILLKRSFEVLRTALAEYAKIMEKILTVLRVIDKDFDPRKRDLKNFILLAQSKIHFYGGDKIIYALNFFKGVQGEYFSNIDEWTYLDHLKNIRSEYEVLTIFILRN